MFKKAMLFIQRVIFRDIGSKLPAGFLKDYIDKSIAIFEKIVNHFEILSKIYIDPYYELVKKEIKIAKISPGSSILVIGCGAIPITAIVLAEETDTKIITIDYDSKAVNLASFYLKKHKFHKKIKIEYANGLQYPVKDFNVIFMSYGIKKQRALLKYLNENIKDNTKIIYRVSSKFENKIQDYNNLLKRFKIEEKIRTYVFGSMDSYLLIKKRIY